MRDTYMKNPNHYITFSESSPPSDIVLLIDDTFSFLIDDTYELLLG